jgi:hypothetical protein
MRAYPHQQHTRNTFRNAYHRPLSFAGIPLRSSITEQPQYAEIKSVGHSWVLQHAASITEPDSAHRGGHVRQWRI